MTNQLLEPTQLPRWDTIIAHQDRKAFLTEEKQYCKKELTEFDKYNWHEKPEPPDAVRQAVLDKRIEFLKMVVKNNTFHFKPTAELNKLR
jgi:hypothetical protein